MRFTFILLLTFFIISVHAQTNLVPNGGFEEYNNCPDAISEFYWSDSYFPYVKNWFAPTGGTSDYFNACASEFSGVNIPITYLWGYTTTRRCDGIRGMYAYAGGAGYREYVSVQMNEPLIAGQQYYVEFWVNPCYYEYFAYNVTVDEFGAYFSEESPAGISGYDALGFEPQIENEEGLYLTDSAIWYKISGVFTAAGGEEYMTIGNFVNDAGTDVVPMYDDTLEFYASSYIFVDDVLVTEYTGDEPDIPGDIILCEGQDVDLTAPFLGISYMWSTGDTTQTITIDEEGEYTVTAYFDCDTLVYTFNVFVFPTETVSSYTEDYICATEFPLLLHGEPGYLTYEWNTGEFTDTITINESGLYIVTAASICNLQIDTFHIEALDPAGINIDLGNDTLICSNEPWEIILDATDDFETHTWSTGESTQTISVTEDGIYSVSAENICGIWADGIVIEAGPVLEKPDLGEDVVLCDEDGFNEVTFTAPEQECSYLWMTGETTQAITVHEPNLVWVECSNVCGKVRDSVIVQLCTWLYVPNAFSPNGDGINDLFYLVAYPNVELISFTIYNRWGELVFETNELTTGWDGIYNGEVLPMETYVYYLEFDEYGFVTRKKGTITLVR